MPCRAIHAEVCPPMTRVRRIRRHPGVRGQRHTEVRGTGRHASLKAARHGTRVRGRDRGRAFRGQGFTLTELMIATVILLIVIIATSKIFGTASDVAGLGEANADILQEAAAIERQIRADFARLSYDAFFAIQSNAVRNDFNGGPLLDPNRSPIDRIRSDQLIFFATGLENTRNFNVSGFQNFANAQSQQSAAARVYYGHAFQIPDAPAVHDATVDWSPWRAGAITLADRDGGGNTNFTAPVVPPSRWLLSRQVVLLANDGGDFNDYYGAANAAQDIWDAELRNGRVDIAGSTLDTVRHGVLRNGDNDFTTVDPWSEQAVMIADAFFFPRAERIPALDSSDANNPDFVRREDLALTSHVIAVGCSEFRVDWTYHNGKGAFDFDGIANSGDELRGVVMPDPHPQMWFGLDDLRALGNSPDYDDLRSDGRYNDVVRYLDWVNAGLGAGSIFPAAIERPILVGGGAPNLQYRAFFGPHRDEPRDVIDIDGDGDTLELILDAGYTPWPDAVRITMTLHDARGRLGNGRTFQFIVELPRRE